MAKLGTCYELGDVEGESVGEFDDDGNEEAEGRENKRKRSKHLMQEAQGKRARYSLRLVGSQHSMSSVSTSSASTVSETSKTDDFI